MMSSRREPQRPPRYAGEDTRLTTTRELTGWYAYGLAADVFSVCGVTSFLPVVLEQLAREQGVLWSDKTTACVAKAPPGNGNGKENNPSLASLFVRTAAEDGSNQCVIHLFGAEITTSSLAMYTFSVSVLVQALVIVSFSSVADHGKYRKRLLLAFGYTGATSSMLFLLVVPRIYLVGCFLVVIGVACLGSSFVLLNSFLPLLVLNHPLVHGRDAQFSEDRSSIPVETFSANFSDSGSMEHDQQHTPLSSSKPWPTSDSTELQISSKISARGISIGYGAAVFVQCLSILLLYVMSKRASSSSSSTLPLRVVLFLVGLWWFVFTIPTQLWLRSRPGPPLDSAMSGRGVSWQSVLNYVTFSWISLWKTIKVAAKLRQVVIFLLAWFLLSDATATVGATAILFARTELKMSTVQAALLSITATSSGIVGAITWPIISRRFSLKTNQTITTCIVLMEIVPLYGLMGYLPFIKAWGVGGLQQQWEIYMVGFIYGFVTGGKDSYCRSFFGQLIPPGSEAAFYSLFALADKGSSAIGPTIAGAIVDATGSIRPTFFFLAVVIAIPGPVIWMVDVDKGQKDAYRMAKTLKVIGGSDDGLDVGLQESERLFDDQD